MKKFISMVLSVLIIAISIPISSYANPEISPKIGEYVVWADTAFIEDWEYEGKKISITIQGEWLTYFKSVFSDESLIYDEAQTLSENAEPTYEKLARFYAEDNSKGNIQYRFYFDSKRVILKKNTDSNVCVFTYKNNLIYNEMKEALAECAKSESQNSPKVSQSKPEDNETQFIYNPSKIYDSQFKVTTNSGVDVNWYFGFFSYSTDENESDTKIASYLSKKEMWDKGVTYGFIAFENEHDNLIEYSNNMYQRLFDINKLEIKKSDMLGYNDVKIILNVSKEREIEAIKVELTAPNGTKEVYNVDMKTFFDSGTVPYSNAFRFSHDANSVIPKEIEDATPEYNYLELWKNSNRKIKSVSYSGISINETKLNTTTIREELDAYLNSLDFKYVNKKPNSTTEIARIVYGSGSEFKYPVYIYETYIEFYAGTQSEYYTFSNSSAKEELKKIFETAVNEYETDFMTYSYRDDADYRYKYEFEITLNEEQKNTWIGEVCENDKVHITVYHKKPNNQNRYQITVSGNGKSYTLASNSTDHLIVEKETPLPYGFEKGGKIVLSWATGENYVDNYKKGTDLTVAIYAKLDNAKRGENKNYTTEPVGGEIKITKIGEVIDLFNQKSEVIESEKPKQVFADVPDSHWAYNEIEKFYYANIVRGIGAGLCAPQDNLTYEQAGILLSRLFGYKYENTSKIPAIRQDIFTAIAKACNIAPSIDYTLFDTYTDKDEILDTNKAYTAALVNESIVQGYEGNLHGNATLTRAEAIALLYRSIKLIYGITDDDIPEEYKLKITPYANEYISVSANIPSKFCVRENVPLYPQWLVNVTEKERMSGSFLMTFGPDAVNDTHIYMVCKIDNAIYTVESTEIDRIEFKSSPYFYIDINAYYNIYKDGKLIVENDKFPLLFEGDMDGVTIGKYSSSYPMTMITFENTELTQGKKPKMPDKQPQQIKQEEYFKEIEEFEGGKNIFATVIEGFGKGLKSDMFNPPSGTFNLKFNKEMTKAKIECSINAVNELETISKISMEITETIEVTQSQTKVKLNIYCDGVLSAENVSATISDIEAELDETVTVSTDDGLWSFTAHIYEIGFANQN